MSCTKNTQFAKYMEKLRLELLHDVGGVKHYIAIIENL